MKKVAVTLLGIVCFGFFGSGAEAATSAGPVPAAYQFFSGGYFGGVKKGMLILNLSNQGQLKTFPASPRLKVIYKGLLTDLEKLPLNTPIRVTTDRGGSLVGIEVLGGEK